MLGAQPRTAHRTPAAAMQPAAGHFGAGAPYDYGERPLQSGGESAADSTERALASLSRKLALDMQWNDVSAAFSERISKDYTSQYPPVETTAMAHLPEFLLQQIDNAECKCFMGLFPALRRVWMTVDHRLFLWNYDDTADFHTFDQMDDIILGVHLFKPKPGVLEDPIQHLIVLVSAKQVRLLGVAESDGGDLSLYVTQIAVNTDGVVMLSACGLPGGQLFLGGRDGHLYELEYEAEESWFKRRASLKNHTKNALAVFIPTFLNFSSKSAIIDLQYDAERQLLHTLSEDSDISVFLVRTESGVDDSGHNAIIVDRLLNINAADSAVRWIGRASADRDMFKLVSIHVVTRPFQGGGNLALVGTTTKGYRIFFNIFGRAVPLKGFHADSIGVAHIRQLPNLDDERDVDALTLPLTQFDTAFFADGLFFAAGTNSTASNVLYASSIDMGSLMKRRIYSEVANLTQTDERVWYICEASDGNAESGMTIPMSGQLSNTLANQLVRWPREFHILTNQGIYFTRQQRPIDHFVNVLSLSHGQETDALRRFLDNFTEEEICCMSLALAAQNTFSRLDSPGSNAAAWDNQISVWATRIFVSFASRQRTIYELRVKDDFDMARPAANGELNQTIGYHATLLYLARCLSSVWYCKLGDLCTSKNSKSISVIVEHLLKLHQFLAQTYRSMESFGAQGFLGLVVPVLDLALQGLQFATLLISGNISNLIKRLSVQVKPFAESCTFGNLLCTKAGHELVRELARLLMNDIISQNANIDSICNFLSDKCNQFFNADDIKIFKAKELIQRARSPNDVPASDLLAEALRLLLTATGSIDSAQLVALCDSFKSLNFFEGIIHLSLACAKHQDPADAALHAYLHGNDAIAIDKSDAIRRRNDCYHSVFELVDSSLQQLTSEASVDALERAFKYSPIFMTILKSDDEYFHYRFYDHMMDKKNLVHILKCSDNVYLEKYLARLQYERSEYGLFLCLLYRHTKKYHLAVTKLFEYAMSANFPANLEKRIELLSMALSIAETKLPAEIDESFINEIRDQIDVANVQLELCRAIVLSFGPSNRHLADLNRNLFNVTELYELCESLDLREVQLSVLFVSGHSDEHLVLNIWRQIMMKCHAVEEKYDKLVTLGQKFFHSDWIVPLVPLILMLESANMDTEPTTYWVVTGLLQAGYSYAEVFAAYDMIINEKRPPFHTSSSLLVLLSKVKIMVEDWLAKDRSSVDAKLLDSRITRYETYLCSLSSGDALLLNQAFQEIAQRL